MRFKPGRLPAGLSFWHPLALLCTWFGSGLLPKVPGTWGSAAALPFAAVIQWGLGNSGLAVGAILLFVAGALASGPFARLAGLKDPGAIVGDEVTAQWATLAAGSLDPTLRVARSAPPRPSPPPPATT